MFRLVLILTIVALAYGRAPHVRSTIPPLDGRIVGGKDTTIEEHPYQLSLGFNWDNHYCGASLIRPNVALTAAHCTDRESADSLLIRAGTTRRASGGKIVGVAKICQHPKYSYSLYDYDVSVLLLNQSFDLSASIQTISPQSLNEDVPVGTNATVTGWGALSSGGSEPEVPLILQEVQVPRVSQEACAAAYSSEDITSRMSCYGYTDGGKDACQGDSGGPLVVGGKVAGIVSWGYGCADPDYPGVYANVADKEINEHINNCINGFETLTG